MDKTAINDDKKAHVACAVHKMPSGMREIHMKYGIWICQSNRNTIPGSVSRTLSICPRYFEFYCISYLINGKGFYWTPDGRIEEFGPGQAVVVTPGSIHCYGGYNDLYDEDTVCFTGQVADGLAKCGVLRDGVVNIGKARKLSPIVELAHDPSDKSQILANMALQNLIFDIYKDSSESDRTDRHNVFDNLVREIKRNPAKWWTVEEMSDFCNMSPTHFNRMFKAYSGLSPKTYMDRFKIQIAAERIANSDENFSEVAEHFGYMDPFHFSRRFKQIIGVSPSDYRRNTRRA